MKAIVKATGVVVEVQECDTTHKGMGYDYVSIHNGYVYKAEDLEIVPEPDYWTRLEHRYAGMAMQGFLVSGMENTYEYIAEFSANQAHALVEKLKKEEEWKKKSI